MILSNYYKWLNEIKSQDAIGGDIVSINSLRSTGGVYPSWLITALNNSNMYNGYLTYNRNIGSGITVVVGSDTGEVTKDAYRLASDVSSSFNLSVQTAFSTESENSVQVFTITGTNTSNQTINVKQIGICKDLKNSSGQPSTFLFAIHLLDSQLSVAPGESFTKVIKWIDE